MNPVDGGSPKDNNPEYPGNNKGVRWARSGMNFNDLTVSPSIDIPGIWHGYISNGIVTWDQAQIPKIG